MRKRKADTNRSRALQQIPREVYRRLAVHVSFAPRRQWRPALGTAVIVGGGMALYAPIVDQSPLLLGVIAGFASFIVMVFLRR